MLGAQGPLNAAGAAGSHAVQHDLARQLALGICGGLRGAAFISSFLSDCWLRQKARVTSRCPAREEHVATKSQIAAPGAVEQPYQQDQPVCVRWSARATGTLMLPGQLHAWLVQVAHHHVSNGHKHLDAARTAACGACASCSPPLQQEGACHTGHQGKARHCQVRHAQVHGACEAGQRGCLQHCHHAARHPGRGELMHRDASTCSQQSTVSAAVSRVESLHGLDIRNECLWACQNRSPGGSRYATLDNDSQQL